jgi:hypothetical protein
MPEYVLLYRATPEARDAAMGSPELARQSMARWMAWMKEMAERGQLKDRGLPLQPPGKVVRGRKKRLTDGPFAETKEVIGGFSIVEAKDIDEAARIAEGCPILEGEGSVEVRPVQKIEG